jgi:hypothetical protein
MKSVAWSCLLVLAGMLGGCVRYYGAATSGNNFIYQPKPVYRDSAVTATYLSQNTYLGPGYNWFRDINVFTQLSSHRSHTFRYANLSYGTFGFVGNYSLAASRKNPVLYPLTGNKLYYGYGIRTGINLNIPTSRIDFRFIGLEMIANRESGEYTRFRRSLAADPPERIFASPDQNLFAAAITSEICIKGPEGSFGGVKLLAGRSFFEQTLPYRSATKIPIRSLTAFVSNGKFTLSIQAGGSQLGIQTGIWYQF